MDVLEYQEDRKESRRQALPGGSAITPAKGMKLRALKRIDHFSAHFHNQRIEHAGPICQLEPRRSMHPDTTTHQG